MVNYKNVKISEDARIAKQSVIIGDVTIGRDSCVLYYTVIRGDEAPIVIGEETNIQENCTVHVSHNKPVSIGNNVTAIGTSAFEGCTALKSVTIGTGVTSIGKDAFKSCKKISAITIRSTKLKAVGSNAFRGIYAKAKIRVPSAKLKAYQKLLKNKGQGSKVKISR